MEIFLSGRNHPLNTHEINLAWNDLKSCNALNGPTKTVEDCRRFFIELKFKTKKKTRDINVNIHTSGGGGLTKALNVVKERVYDRLRTVRSLKLFR